MPFQLMMKHHKLSVSIKKTKYGSPAYGINGLVKILLLKQQYIKLNSPGKHIVKYWMVNPGVVLQKFVLDFGGLKPSYLGPPETRISNNKKAIDMKRNILFCVSVVAISVILFPAAAVRK